jgi:NTE family protein
MGADIVIAVDVMGLDKNQKRPANVIEILQQSIRLLGIERWKKNKEMANIYIQPDLTGFSMLDFENERINKIIRQGDKAAREHMNALLALKDTCGIDSTQIAISSPSPVLPIYKDTLEKPFIFDIHIKGNKKISFSYIYGLIGLKPGDRLDTEDLNRRIMEVYGLGYFESILYDIEPVGENKINLNLTVKELPFRKVRVGLRYDSHYKLVGIVGFHGIIYILSGIRFESELQFAGLSRFSTKLYYPFSRFFQVQYYPYLRTAFKDIPTSIYDRYGNSIAEYPDRSTLIALGMGFMLDKSTNLEIEYNYEHIDIHPLIAYPEPGFFLNWNDNLNNLTLRFDLDNLDHALLPKNGIRIYSEIERSFKILQSPTEYFKAEISMNLYHTWKKRHTSRYFVFYGYSTQSTPIYKHFFIGKPENFVGMNYDQLAGAHLGIIRWEYQYQIKPSVYVKFISNLVPYGEYRYRGETIYFRRLWGIGLGGVITTPVGPIELIVSEGSHGLIVRESRGYHVYFKMGYQF